MNGKREITAGILSIGDELLIGQTINTNAAWIGEQLSLRGIRPVEVLTIADDREAILNALRSIRGDLVLITGGLGPTQDDITKDALCRFFDTTLVNRPEVEAHIVAMFERMGRKHLEANRAQADLPEACAVIPNQLGTAAGMWFEKEGRVFVSMPGVPYEMKAMMEAEILPRAVTQLKPPHIVHRTILTTGLGESHLAERIKDWEAALSDDEVRLAYLPSPGMVKLRLSTYAGKAPDEAHARVARQAEALYRLIPELIFGEGAQRLEGVIGAKLKERGATLALAESCTGGYLGHLVTSVPGSSA
ncbi:MAG: CinA family protein, partial [Flavobacteriales bacterium]|nr:CinA family protein [Flavobacteriales bacterium]